MSRTIIVTGANAGIGFQTTLQLAQAGHRVAMVCRNPAKGEAARAKIAADIGDQDRVRLHMADLGRREDIAEVAEELLETYPQIDTLINNAGVHLNQRTISDEGLEMMFSVNHLATFRLTEALAERITASPLGGRVVTVSSLAHRIAMPNFDDLQAERQSATIQYANTKLYNIWFTRELQRRRPRIIASCYHPGAVATEFAQDDPGLLNTVMRYGRVFLKSAKKAATTGVYLAAADAAEDAAGRYYINSRPFKPSRKARSRHSAERLWHISERLA